MGDVESATIVGDGQAAGAVGYGESVHNLKSGRVQDGEVVRTLLGHI
jgi:hypothetical protein